MPAVTAAERGRSRPEVAANPVGGNDSSDPVGQSDLSARQVANSSWVNSGCEVQPKSASVQRTDSTADHSGAVAGRGVPARVDAVKMDGDWGTARQGASSSWDHSGYEGQPKPAPVQSTASNADPIGDQSAAVGRARVAPTNIEVDWGALADGPPIPCYKVLRN